MTKVCEQCGREYNSRGTRFCSWACYTESKRTIRECVVCHERFMPRKYSTRTQPQVSCSHACADIYQKYQNMTVRECETCGVLFTTHKSWMAKSPVKYCSPACYGKSIRSAEFYAPQGIRNSGIYAEWRKAVFGHDDYTCQDCGQRGGRLNAHHVFAFAQFPEHRLEIWNGTTLCDVCHKKCHQSLVARSAAA